MLTDVTLFRMAPAKGQNQNQDPPPPPPPPEAWQAVMAATNANTQLIMQILQECNQGHGNNQNQFATLNRFLVNQPKTFSNCVEASDADDWLVDICKHFECSNVRPEDFVILPPSNSKTKLQNGSSSTRIPEEDV